VGRLHKFIQTLDDDVYLEISRHAQNRGVSVQEFFRAVVVPDWHAHRLEQSRILQSLNLAPETLETDILRPPQTTLDGAVRDLARRSPYPNKSQGQQ